MSDAPLYALPILGEIQLNLTGNGLSMTKRKIRQAQKHRIASRLSPTLCG